MLQQIESVSDSESVVRTVLGCDILSFTIQKYLIQKIDVSVAIATATIINA